MLPASDIAQYGGKGAILNHIVAKAPQIPVPPYTILNAGSSIDSILGDFEMLKKPVIVRSSSPLEYGGFEGIFESVGDVTDLAGLGAAVATVRASAMSQVAQTYAAQRGVTLESAMHIVVQEQSDSQFTGAMMRHPNEPELIFIDYHNNAGPFRNQYRRFLFDEHRPEVSAVRKAFMPMGITPAQATELVDWYRQVESLQDIADGETLFVEFGYLPFQLYQARPFKQIETADFELPPGGLRMDLAFGITPPDGIILPALRTLGYLDALGLARKMAEFGDAPVKFGPFDGGLKMHLGNAGSLYYTLNDLSDAELKRMLGLNLREHIHDCDDAIEGPYALVASAAKNESYPIDLDAIRMKALIVSKSDDFLVHDMMRLLAKVEVTGMYSDLTLSPFFQGLRSVEDRVRIISNGKEAVAFKE